MLQAKDGWLPLTWIVWVFSPGKDNFIPSNPGGQGTNRTKCCAMQFILRLLGKEALHKTIIQSTPKQSTGLEKKVPSSTSFGVWW
jgi:hypothetical protein